MLDAGCGSGFFTSLLAEHFPSAIIHAVDNFGSQSLAGNSLRRLVKNLDSLKISKRVNIRVSSILALPFDEEYFSLVASNLVLHNLARNFSRGIMEILRVLKPDGLFIYGDMFAGRYFDLIEERFTVEKSFELKRAGIPKYRLMLLRKNS
ncbi:MAG: class I SAM-dependent methyltransferase [Nitrososphaerota archaeon]|nr:class I SAM-dependent methyltransferase [Nitrososphaerota archaeon]MDG6930068.1 class I SAM-dependent methyltransferase [Nitrososphaerota archaeon]MDG6931778.1 class I SAM-dependent methyltransferase [Nitrososphaerota archaeon]MDG6935839.1 class I SAM-dependent methyltransferase [Nitrososphaerota archaeon]MDG6944606.1 class I SAM-dependent methyltransferase [Nitrososphaerota archaeon]